MPAAHVAVVSRDAELVGEVRRLAALVGQTVQVAGQPADCARVCRAAALVVVDAAAGDLFDASVPVTDAVVVADDPHRIATWEMAVHIGARRVVTLPAEAAALLDLLALAGERPGPPGPLIGVVGGVGGAGASVLSVASGWALTQTGRPTTVADLDVRGGGLDVLVGLERAAGLRWGDLADARGVIASASLRGQLPAVDGVAVLSVASGVRSGDVDTSRLPDRGAMSSVLAAARRGGDAVVVDLPRHFDGDVSAVIAGCDVVLLLTPAHVRAVSAAACIVPRLHRWCNDVSLVVRRDGRRLHDRDVVTALGLPHVATVPTLSGVTAAVERGQLVQSLRRSALGRAARTIAERLLSDVVAGAS